MVPTVPQLVMGCEDPKSGDDLEVDGIFVIVGNPWDEQQDVLEKDHDDEDEEEVAVAAAEEVMDDGGASFSSSGGSRADVAVHRWKTDMRLSKKKTKPAPELRPWIGPIPKEVFVHDSMVTNDDVEQPTELSGGGVLARDALCEMPHTIAVATVLQPVESLKSQTSPILPVPTGLEQQNGLSSAGGLTSATSRDAQVAVVSTPAAEAAVRLVDPVREVVQQRLQGLVFPQTLPVLPPQVEMTLGTALNAKEAATDGFYLGAAGFSNSEDARCSPSPGAEQRDGTCRLQQKRASARARGAVAARPGRRRAGRSVVPRQFVEQVVRVLRGERSRSSRAPWRRSAPSYVRAVRWRTGRRRDGDMVE
ncbi:hypothetical protein ZWY2020_045101 [Hordeum vulgare]|nr:hypothetical protein ZWY2020_045101 [Hordeum vulgare]